MNSEEKEEDMFIGTTGIKNDIKNVSPLIKKFCLGKTVVTSYTLYLEAATWYIL